MLKTHSFPSESTSPHGRIQEIFSSLQGEGLYWGKRQIFIRFFGCNMKCVYCDEVGRHYEDQTPEEVLGEVKALEREEGPHHSVSLTGGEPLAHNEFLLALSPLLKERGFRLYLQTNGTFPERLKRLIPYLDIISMDLKPPSSTQDRDFWEDHRLFLEIAQEKELFTKIVVTAETEMEEIRQAIRLVAGVNPQIPLVLQPVTPFGEVTERVSQKKLFDLALLARERLSDVRILSQLHKITGVR